MSLAPHPLSHLSRQPFRHPSTCLSVHLALRPSIHTSNLHPVCSLLNSVPRGLASVIKSKWIGILCQLSCLQCTTPPLLPVALPFGEWRPELPGKLPLRNFNPLLKIQWAKLTFTHINAVSPGACVTFARRTTAHKIHFINWKIFIIFIMWTNINNVMK